MKDLSLGVLLEFSFNEKAKLLTYPLETISQSEGGVDTITQGQTFGFLFPFKKDKIVKGCLTVEVKNV